MIGDLKTFDQMVNLAKDNPGLLEKMRKQEVENIIQAAPEHMQRRLRGLQFQIDAKRQGQKNSMSACIAISHMMHESLNRLNAVLNGKAGATEKEGEELKDSKVLSFPAVG